MEDEFQRKREERERTFSAERQRINDESTAERQRIDDEYNSRCEVIQRRISENQRIHDTFLAQMRVLGEERHRLSTVLNSSFSYGLHW